MDGSDPPAAAGRTGVVTDRVRAEIEFADEGFVAAVDRRDAGGACESYARQAQLQPPGAPAVHGRADIAGFWRAAQEQLGLRAVAITTTGLRPAGDLVHQVGELRLAFEGGRESKGCYAVLWAREDGVLKRQVATWNLDR